MAPTFLFVKVDRDEPEHFRSKVARPRVALTKIARVSGVDLSGADDQVTDVLLDLARQETQPRTDALARAVANGMAQQGGPMNSKPLRSASFSVLKAADIPSVLVELGFLSSPRDLKNLVNPEWRIGMAQGIHQGLEAWRQQDLIRRGLIGQ